MAYPKTSERGGMSRFYRAPMVKAHVPDIVFMIDKIERGEYRVSREKAKGRNVGWDDVTKTLQVNWGLMEIEDVTY